MATLTAVEPETVTETKPVAREHGPIWRYLVRAAICLFFVQGGTSMFPLALNIPILEKLVQGPLIQWMQMHRPLRMNGSTEFDLMLGLGGGLIWFLISRRTKYEDVLYHVARLEARYALGACMFGFGLIKMFSNENGAPAQLWPPMPADLLTPFNESTINFLAWRYIGVAPTYHHFTGLVEAIGGLLLFNRRTTTLGAFINLASILNIAMLMGFAGLSLAGFWLPMRRIFLIAFLLYDDRRRIINFFVRDGSSVPPRPAFVWPKEWMRRTAIALQIAFVLVTIHLIDNRITRDWWRQRPRSAIDAIYEVSSFTANGDTLPDARGMERWSRLAIYGCNATARTLDDKAVDFGIVGDAAQVEGLNHGLCGESASVPLTASGRPYRYLTRREPLFRYSIGPSGELTLRGEIKGTAVSATLRRLPDQGFALFDPHWWWVTGGPGGRRAAM